MKDAADILGDLATLLSSFQGREYSAQIQRETLFFADLGFASIDAVVLGEELDAFYQHKFPFNRFLADAAQRNAQDIRVGDLADFLAAELGVPSS